MRSENHTWIALDDLCWLQAVTLGPTASSHPLATMTLLSAARNHCACVDSARRAHQAWIVAAGVHVHLQHLWTLPHQADLPSHWEGHSGRLHFQSIHCCGRTLLVSQLAFSRGHLVRRDTNFQAISRPYLG